MLVPDKSVCGIDDNQTMANGHACPASHPDLHPLAGGATERDGCHSNLASVAAESLLGCHRLPRRLVVAQMRALRPQDRPHLAHIDLARLHTPVRRHRRPHARRMAGQPALRDLAHEAMAVGVAGNVPPRRQHPVERAGDQRAIGHRDHREFGADRRADPRLVRRRRAAAAG